MLTNTSVSLGLLWTPPAGLHNKARVIPLTQGYTRVVVGRLELVDNSVTWATA